MTPQLIRIAALSIAAMLSQNVHAINKGQMGQFRYSGSGNSVSIKPNQSGSSGSLSGIADMRGSIGTPIGNTGWYRGGNAPGSGSTGTTMHMGHNGDVFIAGTKYPFQAGYQVPKKNVVEALGILCKNPVICLGLSLTAPAIVDWLNKGNVGINTNEADYPEKPFTLKPEYPGKEFRLNGGQMWHASPEAACAEAVKQIAAQYSPKLEKVITGNGRPIACRVTYKPTANQSSFQDFALDDRDTITYDNLPASMDDIAPYMDAPEVTPNVVRDLLDKGADINLPSAPTVSGPTEIKGPINTTKNPDGSTTTRQTINNYRTEGNRITNISTVTVTNTCTAAGSCTRTTDETKPDPDTPDDEQPDDTANDTALPDVPKLYKRKYPDGLVGVWNSKKDELKQTSLMTFAEQLMPTSFVSGTCPRWQLDLSFEAWADYGVREVEYPCWLWDVAKTIVIVSALILARALIFGG